MKWTKTAAKNFSKPVDYLIENWSDAVVSDFIRRTDEIQEKKREIRGVLLSVHNKLFYRTEGNRLIILKIFDTRQNPRKLRFR